MRHFIRHPSDIPISYDFSDHNPPEKNYLNDISVGGLCFQTDNYINPGQLIHIHIQLLKPPFEASGLVVWCRENKDRYDTGVQFGDPQTAFAVRMVKQICHIEHYRTQVFKKEGRKLSSEEAAAEWIEKHAAGFPQ